MKDKFEQQWLVKKKSKDLSVVVVANSKLKNTNILMIHTSAHLNSIGYLSKNLAHFKLKEDRKYI